MNKSSYLWVVPVVAGLLGACSGNPKENASDSTAVRTDSTRTAGISAADSVFAEKAAIGGMAEVALGKLAQAKGSSQAVKAFADMMVTDHGKANEELMRIAKSRNIPLPGGLDAEHQAKSDSLSKLSGKAFEKGYVDAMVEGHQKNLALMQAQASGGQDPELKDFAAKTAPVVGHHLMEIQKIKAGMKP